MSGQEASKMRFLMMFSLQCGDAVINRQSPGPGTAFAAVIWDEITLSLR